MQRQSPPGAPDVVQRADQESTPIGDVATGEAATEQIDTGVIAAAELATAQRQAADAPGPPVVQRMTRQEEVDLSLSSPGRAVLDPSRPSLSLYNFGIDRAQPKAFHLALLGEFSRFLRNEVPAPTRLRVSGHADPTGSGPYNQELSARRSAAVAAVLQAQGSATETLAEGDTRPVASNATVEGRSRNRRADILVDTAGPPEPPGPPDRPRRPEEPERSFCDEYPLLCGISPPGPFVPPWPLLCLLVPELCLLVPCILNPAVCMPPPPPPPPDDPSRPDRPTGGPQVLFGRVRAANTPSAMGDRIPDRGVVPVAAVVAGGDPGAEPITVRVAGAPGPHGDALVNGAPTAAISGSTVLAVSGTAQTSMSSGAFRLALEALHGGQVVGRSHPFAVSAIMFDMRTSKAGEVVDATGVTLEALMGKSSDGAAGIASLNEMEYGEHLLLVEETGGMTGAGLGEHGFLALADIDQVDRHGTEMRHMLRPGSQTLHQTHSFLDHRTGSHEIPVANSGFSVVRTVAPDPDRPGCLVFTVVKRGHGATADGVASGPGTGVAAARVPLPCPPGPDRPGGATDPATPTIPVPYTGPVPPGSTPIFYQGGVSPSASAGDVVSLTFSFRVRGERFFSIIPCVVTGAGPDAIELESLNPVPVNVAPLQSPQPIVLPARKRMTVPRSLL